MWVLIQDPGLSHLWNVGSHSRPRPESPLECGFSLGPVEIFKRWKSPLECIASAGQLTDGKHSDSESYSVSPGVTQHRDERNTAGAEEARGDVPDF